MMQSIILVRSKPSSDGADQQLSRYKNLNVLAEKHKEMGQFAYNTFIDTQKCFDRIWSEGLWAVL